MKGLQEMAKGKVGSQLQLGVNEVGYQENYQYTTFLAIAKRHWMVLFADECLLAGDVLVIF